MSKRSLVVLAPAKINLALHVTGLRDDGYHLIDTIAGFAAFGDELEIVAAEEAAAANRLAISGPFADALRTGGASPGDNLVLRAATALAKAAADAPGRSGVGALQAAEFHLDKQLPIASGIGGGSADAAAALIGLDRFWQLDGAVPLAGIANKLGADVAMCLESGPLRARGIGEQLTPASLCGELPCVLVNPLIGLSTPQVFSRLANKHNAPLDWNGTDAVTPELLARFRNDLEAPATTIAPAIGTVLNILRRQPECGLARMSGSGATCFGLFDTMQAAESAARNILDAQPGWWCVATRITARRAVRFRQDIGVLHGQD